MSNKQASNIYAPVNVKQFFVMILVIQIKLQALELKGVPYRHFPLYIIYGIARKKKQ